MGRLLAALVLTLFLGEALAAPALVVSEVCSAACPDEVPEDCSPTCLECGCCSHVTRTLTASPGVPAPLGPPRLHVLPGAADRLPAWDPEDVFHVPIPRPA